MVKNHSKTKKNSFHESKVTGIDFNNWEKRSPERVS